MGSLSPTTKRHKTQKLRDFCSELRNLIPLTFTLFRNWNYCRLQWSLNALVKAAGDLTAKQDEYSKSVGTQRRLYSITFVTRLRFTITVVTFLTASFLPWRKKCVLLETNLSSNFEIMIFGKIIFTQLSLTAKMKSFRSIAANWSMWSATPSSSS